MLSFSSTSSAAPTTLDEVDTPAVVIDLEVVERNLARMATIARDGDVALWPHAKSHKIPELARLQVDAGAAGITCQKIGEAEVMADAGLPDILISYPIVGAPKVERLMALAERTRVTTVVDSLDAATVLGRAAAARGLAIETLLEVDVGYRRCGVRPDDAREIAERLVEVPGLRLAGLLAYEGHIYDQAGPETAERRARAAYDLLGVVADAIRAAGIAVERVSVGATATAALAAGHDAITELRAGSYLFNDRTQVAMGAATEDDCALSVLSTVVSTAAGGHVVIDAGSKALTFTALVGGSGYGVVAGRPDLVVERLSDEHGMIPLVGGARAPEVGDRLHVVPNAHAAVIDNFSDAVAVRDGEPVGAFSVAARGRMQ